MTTERIDVLAVMDMHLAAMAAGRSNVPCANLAFYDESRKQFEQARAAVAELIEAGKAGVVSNNQTFDVVTSQRIACGELSAPEPHMTLTFHGKSAERLIAALASVGGA